jgi:signal transduction histidine kinase
MPNALKARDEVSGTEPESREHPDSPTPSPDGLGRRREVLRLASVALGRPVVVLWQVSPAAEVVPVLTSVSDPPHHATALDLEGTLRRWGLPVIEGNAWVGVRLANRWCLAPVRSDPPASPPGSERRSRERVILEMAGLLLGEIGPAYARPRWPEPDALQELARQPSVIAHEVANPLTAALLTLELAQEDIRAMPLADGFRTSLLDSLGEVGEGMEHAMAFLRAIQDRARGVLARSERFDATGVVRSCVTLERPLARQMGVLLQDELWTNDVFLYGDPNALYRILTTLVRRAVLASSGRKLPVLVEQVQVGSHMRLSVRDGGVGIPAEDLDRIFEAGFTTTPGGAVPGLSIVRETAEQMFGGSVKVESAAGLGTTVTVTLPIPPQRIGRGRRSDEGRDIEVRADERSA